MTEIDQRNQPSYSPLKIGTVSLETPFLSAPMAGFTNGAFRTLLRSFGGVGLIATEMVSARAFVYMAAAGESPPDRLWGIAEEPGPLSVQIWDNQPETLAKTAQKIITQYHPAIIDLNFGCPAPKITKNSASGSALLRNPEKVGKIVSLVVQVAREQSPLQPTPITAKIRLGLTVDTINAIDVAQAVEGAGGSALTIHGRTASQMYRGEASWDEIARVKPFLKTIPLIGNGDIKTAAEAVHRLKTYPVDGVMIGRAALTSPWIFLQAKKLWLGLDPFVEPNPEEEKKLLLKHFSLVCQRFGEEKGTLFMRKYAAQWSHGKPGAKQFRIAAAECTKPDEFIKTVQNWSLTGD